MASIHTRRNKNGTTTYRVAFRTSTKQASESFSTYKQAEYFAKLVERIGGDAARAKRDSAERQLPNLTEVLEDYISQAPDITTGTADDYRQLINVRSGILDQVADLPINIIDRTDIEAWVRKRSNTLSERTGKPISPKTIRNEHGLISTLFEHAILRGWIQTNPAKKVRLPKKARNEINILTPEEFAKIWNELTPHYRPLVRLLAATGMRYGEATALQWKDVGTVDHPWVRVTQAWKRVSTGKELGAPKTAKSYRTIEVEAATIVALGTRGAPTELVFKNRRGDRVLHSTFWNEHWKKAANRAGFDPAPRLHSLRHFAASYMLASGADLFEVSRALGHASLSITADIYGHLVPSRTRPSVTHAAMVSQLLDGAAIIEGELAYSGADGRFLEVAHD